MTDFWLSEAQFERLRPLLPNKPRGVPRVAISRAANQAAGSERGRKQSTRGRMSCASINRSPGGCRL